MSYDYHALKLAREIAYLSEIGRATVVGLGTWSSVREQVSSIIPGIEWVAWGGSVRTEHGWIEFGIEEGAVLDFGFTIRTSLRSDHQWEENLLGELCRAFDWSIVDGQGRSETYKMIHAGGVRQLGGRREGSSQSSIADSASAWLFCPPLGSSDERPFRLVDIVEEELGEPLEHLVDSLTPVKRGDRRAFIEGRLRQIATRLPPFSNGKETWARNISAAGDMRPTGPGRKQQLRIQVSFPRSLAGTRGESLLAELGPAMGAWWGAISFADLASSTGHQYSNSLEPPKRPPEGLPRLTRGHLLDSIARPHQLGWLNYWSHEAATLAGFDASHDEAIVDGVRRIADRGWLVRLTEEPLDLSRATHRARLSAAYERFRGVGRVGVG